MYIYNNTAPYNVTTIPNQSFNAGYALSFSFNDSIFTDTDGETVSLYTYTSSPSATGWLSFDSATRTFSGTPAVNADAYNYTITVRAQDPNQYSADGSTSFMLEVIPNELPTYDKGFGTVDNATVYFPWTYTLPSDAFTDNEGDGMQIETHLSPDNFIINFDFSTQTVSGELDDNTLAGAYTVHFYVTDTWNVSTFDASFVFYYQANQPPVVDTAPTDPPSVIAHYPFSYVISKSSFHEPENEAISYSYTTNDTDARSSWLSMTENSTDLLFEGTPNNTQFGNFNITLTLVDGHPDVAETNTYFTI